MPSNSQPIVGPNQPFLLQATAFDPDNLPLPLSFLWIQLSGPDTALFNSITLLEPVVICSSLGTYRFQLTASDGVSATSEVVDVTISHVYRAAQSYTAFCGSGSNGLPVTVITSVASSLSLEDAEIQAMNQAQAQAFAGLHCIPNVPPVVIIGASIPSVSATVTYTAACAPPNSGVPISIVNTFSDIGRTYASVEQSSLTVARTRANALLQCARVNVAPVVYLDGFNFTVSATATATATCLDIASIEYGPPVSFSQTVSMSNVSYEEVERAAYVQARTSALAAVQCTANVAPLVTFGDIIPTITAIVSVALHCITGQGAPVLITKSFTSLDFDVSEGLALAAAYAEANADLICVPNVPPSAYIATTSNLIYRANIPYRNRNLYRSSIATTSDFNYLASATSSASCPAGSYGPGTYATTMASSTISYADAEARAKLLAQAQAQAKLSCTLYTNRIASTDL